MRQEERAVGVLCPGLGCLGRQPPSSQPSPSRAKEKERRLRRPADAAHRCCSSRERENGTPWERRVADVRARVLGVVWFDTVRRGLWTGSP